MMLPYLIVMGALNALFILGCWNAFLPGQLLGEVGDWLAGNRFLEREGKLPEWITKPLFTCPMCCASFHGTFWWFVFQMGPWYILPFYVVCLSGLLKCVAILILNADKDS